MSHKSIRLLIQDTAKSLADNIQFNYARTSDFNVIRDKKYPFINCDPISAVPQFATDGVLNYMKAWSVSMAFYQLDKEGSTGDEYALILDEMDLYVDQFINKLNRFSYDSDKILIQSVNQQPFIKATADILTGYLLTFTIFAQDDFEYCEIDCEITDEC